MIYRRIIAATALLCMLAGQSHAQTGSQKTPAQLNAEINSFFASNSVGAITPSILRQFTLDLVASSVEKLTADRNYWFRNDGSDSACDGMTNSPSAPGTTACAFASPQTGFTAAAKINNNGFNISVKYGQASAFCSSCTAHTFTTGVTITAPFIGSGTVSLVGDIATPTNCNITPTTGDAVNVAGGATINVSGLSVGADAVNGWSGLVVGYGSQINVNGNMDYRSAFVHMFAPHGGSIFHSNNPTYTVSGAYASGYHIFAGDTGGKVTNLGATAVVNANLTILTWAFAKNNAFISSGSTITNAFTVHGKKFDVQSGAVITVSGGSINYFPGDIAGTQTTGGNYTGQAWINAATDVFGSIPVDLSTLTGLGTGVKTALGLNVGSAGAPVLFNGAGGTPSSMVGTNITGTASGLTAGNVTTNANLTGDVTSVGNATTLATVNGNVGTFGNSSTYLQVTADAKGRLLGLVGGPMTPALNNITGFGTNVAAALATNIGSAGAPVLFNGAGGTPSSMIGTNITGTAASLTAGTANAVAVGNITGAASGCTTWLTTATSANLRSCLTDETGTGVAYFQGGDIGTPSAGVGSNLTSTTRQLLPISWVGGTQPQATTQFEIGSGSSGTEANVQALCPKAGTFKNLYLQSSAPAAGQTLIATWRVNGADTAITCTITGTGTTCNDTTHTAACTVGQTFSLKTVTSATTGTITSLNGGIEFDN